MMTVEAFERGTANPVACSYVDLWLNPNTNGAPTIDWPERDGYTIEGPERDYFVTWGSSNLPITSVTLGSAPAQIVEWYEDVDFWWATFSPGTAPGSMNNVTLLASNADGDGRRTVNVA